MVEHVVCACVIVRALVGFWQESWESEGWRRGVSLIVLCSCACGGLAQLKHGTPLETYDTMLEWHHRTYYVLFSLRVAGA